VVNRPGDARTSLLSHPATECFGSRGATSSPKGKDMAEWQKLLSFWESFFIIN